MPTLTIFGLIFEPCIVPPTTSKANFYASAFFANLWRLADQALRAADELVVIGYSLPPADTAVRALLSTSFPSGPVTVVDVKEATADRYRQVFGDRVDSTFVGSDALQRYVDATKP